MTEFNFATMETENLDYRTMTKKDADDIKKNEEILSERTTKSGLRIVSDTYAVRTGITFPKKPMTDHEKNIYLNLEINREYSPGMLKPFLRSINSLIKKGYLKKQTNKYGIEVIKK